MHLQVRRGRPDAAELAAVVVALGVVAARRPPDPGPAPRSEPVWATPHWAGDHAGTGSWSGLAPGHRT